MARTIVESLPETQGLHSRPVGLPLDLDIPTIGVIYSINQIRSHRVMKSALLWNIVQDKTDKLKLSRLVDVTFHYERVAIRDRVEIQKIST